MFTLFRSRREMLRVTRTCNRFIPNFEQCSLFGTYNADKNIQIPHVTLPELLETYYHKYHKYTAIECYYTKRKYTYGDIIRKSTTFSKALRKIIKLKEGDVVGMVLDNQPEFPIVWCGTLKANLTITTINETFLPNEVCNQILNTDVKAVITSFDLMSLVEKAIELSRKKIPIIAVKTKNGQTLPDNIINFHELSNQNFDYPDIAPWHYENVAHIPYSSGTTGLPKGIQLTHKNLIANLVQREHQDYKYTLEATENHREILPTVLPFCHLYGNVVIFHTSSVCGGKMITIPKYNPSSFKSILKDHGATTLYLVPPLVLFLMNDKDVSKEWFRKTRIVHSGAAPLAKTDEEKFLDTFGDHMRFIQSYGLSETSPLITLTPAVPIKSSRFAGSVGKVLPLTEIKIVDPNNSTDTALGANTPGELLVRGPQVMKGYSKAPAETAKVLSKDGWLRTGDILHYDDDGLLFVSGRIKDLIKVKANQVSPLELEALVRSFPGVSECAVIGIPDDISGELPRAYVVPTTGTSLDLKKLDSYVNERVAKFKRLKGGVVVVKEIPKTPSGKILKRLILENYKSRGI